MTPSNKRSNDNKTAIIFGATGAVGRHLVDIVVAEQPSWTVLAVSRNAETKIFSHLPSVQVLQGDPNNRESVLALSKDADIVYSCIGFNRYEAKYWSKHWPIIADNLLAGSNQQLHQKLVFCDNLYAYGSGNISPSKDPALCVQPTSRPSKPGTRAAMWKQFQPRLDDKRMVIVGGADFFGRYVTASGFMGETFVGAITKGQKPMAVGSSTVVHDFCFVPDFARALYVASINDDAYGRKWICPHTIHGKSMTDIAQDVGQIVQAQNGKSGRKRAKKILVTTYSKRFIWMLSPFVGIMGEILEMLPIWTKDYTVDDSDFIDTFGMKATPYDEALRSYVDFWKGEVEPQ